MWGWGLNISTAEGSLGERDEREVAFKQTTNDATLHGLCTWHSTCQPARSSPSTVFHLPNND